MKKENIDQVKKLREKRINQFMLNTKCSNKVIRFVNDNILNTYSTKIAKDDKCINKWEYFKSNNIHVDDKLKNNCHKILSIRKVDASEVDKYPVRENKISLKKFSGVDMNTIISTENSYTPIHKNTFSINGIESIKKDFSQKKIKKTRPDTAKPFMNKSNKNLEKNTSHSSILSNVYTEQNNFQSNKNHNYYLTSPTHNSSKKFTKLLLTENSSPNKLKIVKNHDLSGSKNFIERSKTFIHKKNSSIAFSNPSSTRNNSINTNLMLITKNSFNTLNHTSNNTKNFETLNNIKNKKNFSFSKQTTRSSKQFRPLSFSKTSGSGSMDDQECLKSITPSLPESLQNIYIHPENKILQLFKSLSEKENLSGVGSLNLKNKNVSGDIRSMMKNLKIEVGKNSRKMKTIIDDLKRTQFNNDEYLKAYSSILKVALLKKQKRDVYEEDAY
jgi:hypothetical protein